MEVIGGYIIPLTSSMKVVNNDTCKWKLQIILFLYNFFFFEILFLYNYTYNMATNLIYYGSQYYIYIYNYIIKLFLCVNTCPLANLHDV
jgi:hypothetical protein